MKKSIQLKPYTVMEMARIYGVSDRTMKKWLKPFEAQIGEKIGYFYTIAQVQIIFDKLGVPGEVESE
jgi:hypothetical protein